MNLERIALAAALLAVAGLAGWNVQLRRELGAVGATAPESAPAEGSAQALRAEPERSRPRARAVDGAGDRGASGPEVVAIEAAAPASEPPRPEPRDWEAMRGEIEAGTVDVVEAMAAQRGWSDEATDEVLAILLENGQAIGQLWGRVHEGELTHYQARKQMGELRDAAGAELEELIGVDAHEELEEHLFEARREVFHREHEGGRGGPPHP